ncbi:MAG: transcriptional regulator [Desulfobacterales bacterium]|nr:transcriptional regulator [Desulfobacterales bacterium]
MLTESYHEVLEHWISVRDLLSVPKSDEQCDRMIEFLNNLLYEVGNDEKHPLFSLIETLATLIEGYESKTIPESESTPIELLKLLMEENKLTPKDLK